MGDMRPSPSRGSPPHHSQIQAVDHPHHKASQMLLRQPLVNRRRQKEPGLAVDRPEIAHRGKILEKRSKRALILSDPPQGVKSDRLLGDGGYDRTGVYTTLNERHPDAGIVVPPRADAVLSATADTEPTQRDCHIQAIAGNGRMAWQRDSGYNERARVEGQFARWKQVIGDGLRFHSDEAWATEVAIAAQVLNRMLDRPNSVRVA